MAVTLERASELLADVVRTLGRVNGDAEAAKSILAVLGWDLPPGIADIGLAQVDVSAVAAKLDALIAVRARENVSDAEIAAAAAELIAALAAALAHLKALGASFQAPQAYLQATDIVDQFFPRLADLLLIQALASVSPLTVHLAMLLGVTEFRRMAADPAIFQVNHVRQAVRWDRIGRLFSEPSTLMHDVYGWGTPGFKADALIGNIMRLLEYFGADVSVRPLPRAAEEALTGQPAPEADVAPARQLLASLARDLGFDGVDVGVSLYPLRESTPGAGDAGLGVSPYAFGTTSARFPLSSTLALTLSGSGELEGGLGLILRPGHDPQLRAGLIEAPRDASDATFSAALRLAAPDDERWLLFSAPAISVDAKAIAAGLGIEKGAGLDPLLMLKVEDGLIRIGSDRSDGFLASILPEDGVSAPFSLELRWSRLQGVHIRGSAGLKLSLGLHKRLGPVRIETLELAITAAPDALTGAGTVSAATTIGPITATIGGVGAAAALQFKDGNLGPVNLDFSFVPPSEIGIRIDGGGFTGGGFLRALRESGEYAGALELQFQEVVHVKAIGVLNTRAPDAGAMFSLVIVISAEFTPIQLSFGFTLNGIGGLLGINRTALYDQLRLGLRDGALESILFPRDVIANAPRIINDLKRIFPSMGGRFLIGPMAKLGWGTPPLVTLDLGILLEIPRPGFAILGVLRIAMPAADVPIINLQVNFLGVVDFDKKELSFDASLFDSRLMTFTLTGDMAVRLYWGDNANFLLTAGGFHPAYTPPPLGLPPIKRLAIAFLQGNPRLTAEAYLAVTSNTVQFGAKVELYYGVKVFNVYGFISLDALIQFDPFRFVAQIVGSVAVRSGSSTLFSIRLELTLEGPMPWRARGKGSFEIGFIFTITISASFDVTFGEERDTTLAPISVMPLIEAALRADGNWRVFADARLLQHVSLRETPPEAGPIVSPYGALAVSQKVAPLNTPLARIGPARIAGASRFSLVNVRLGSDPTPTRPVQEQFAAAQFLDLGDADKLSRRSFEPFDAGIEIAGSEPRADYQRSAEVTYEVIYLRKPRRRLFLKLRDGLLDLLVLSSAAARSKFGAARRAPSGLGTPKVALATETFVIAGVDDLKPRAGIAAFRSETAAALAMLDIVRADARLAGKLQVVSSYEAAA